MVSTEMGNKLEVVAEIEGDTTGHAVAVADDIVVRVPD